ncbi:hypothetical protein [uncultured Bacteroides sp.]|uniref:hypothetical protein n=1 Tax=uncultured Bacteroides sp. TaxID=162156 RepID=UPI0025E09783|nr:hypothetical protein [uncultured Bacteroides sp.]
MTKQLIFIFAVLCSLQAHASVQSAQGDTVRSLSFYNVTEELQPIQPVYLDGVTLPASQTGNWFVSITGGAMAFLGTPIGCEDLFGRLKPSYSLAVGKWFTPSVGARISYSGLQFKDGTLSTQDYHHIHADLLWNILGRRYARQEQVRWLFAPFAGVGLLHNVTNKHNPLAVSYGLQGQYNISKRVSAILELSGTTTFQDFDGYGHPNRLGDHMLLLTAGFTFHLGKVGWKRTVDATPYVRQNEWLVDYASFLSKENKHYANLNDQNHRTFVELKKILEIEGLLDKYGHLIKEDNTNGHKGYPMNNYSGLNSLLARLKNRHWNGNSPLDSINIQSGNNGCSFAESATIGSGGMIPMPAEKCIGSPVYFFFNLNTVHLTDASQILNLDELARVANKHGLSVRVIGAADSSTGTPVLNNSLSMSRTDYIVSELGKRDIPTERIVKVSRGGIADHIPVEANRHTKVELFFAE